MTGTMLRVTVLAAALLAAAVASAATLYVSPKGDDANPGTEAAPFRTIGKATQAAGPGDTVLVHAGSYPGGIRLNGRGPEHQPITLKAFGDGPVTVEGGRVRKTGVQPVAGLKHTWWVAETEPVAGVAADLNTSPLIMDGLQPVGSVEQVEAGPLRFWHDRQAGRLYLRYLEGSPEAGHTVHVLREATGLTIAGTDVVVDGLTIRGFAATAISIEGARRVTVQNCTLSLCGYPWGAGVSLYQTEAVTVSNCLLHRLMNGFLLTAARGTRVVHNTIYRTRAHGLLLENADRNGPSSDTTVRNNIIYAGGRSGSALWVGQAAAAGLQLDTNCYLDSGTSMLISWMPTGARFPTFWDFRQAIATQDQHSFSDDPLFVSTQQGAEDFGLQPGSPCRGRGDDGQDLGCMAAPQSRARH
jgi:hypothetical protein